MTLLRTTMTVDAVAIRLTPPSKAAAPIADITPGSIHLQIPVGYSFPVIEWNREQSPTPIARPYRLPDTLLKCSHIAHSGVARIWSEEGHETNGK